MKLHGSTPEDYLAFVHDIDLSVLAPDPALASRWRFCRAGASFSPMAAATMPRACWSG
jgi:hypothetical protein